MPKVSQSTVTPGAATPGAAAAAAPGVPTAGFGAVAVPPGVPPPRLGGANPDTMIKTGLANNFNGRVQALWLVPRKYPLDAKRKSRAQGQTETYALTCAVSILADDHSLGNDGIVTEFLRMDDLVQWVPSRVDPYWNGTSWVYTPAGSVAGRAATLDDYVQLHNGFGFPVQNADGTQGTAILAPEDWWGFFAIPGKMNNRDGFKKDTKFDQFLTALKTIGYPAQKAPHINPFDFRQFLVGVYGHWVRLPFEFKGGSPPDLGEGTGGGRQQVDTLCLTDILDLGPVSGSQGPVAAGQAATAVSVAVPAPMLPVAAPAPAPAPVPAPAPAPLPVAAPVAPAAPVAAAPPSAAPAGLTERNDPTAISAATNEILTGMAAQRGVAGLLKSEAGQAVYEQVNARGLDGAMAIRFLNDNDWIVADERTFGYVPERGLIVPLLKGA